MPSLDNNAGGYSSPYPHNVDAALQAIRAHPLDYAFPDDSDNRPQSDRQPAPVTATQDPL